MAKSRSEIVADLPMTAKTLRTLGFSWLRYTQSCWLVAFERSPYSARNLPDVLGLNKKRQLIEIEIKVDKADFDKDNKKKHRQRMLDELSKFQPRAVNYFYYLVPPKLVNHVMENVPEHAGVLTVNALEFDPYTGFPVLTVLKPALRLHDNRLSIKNTVVMARDMAGTMASLLRDDVKRNVKVSKMETQIVALGGVLPKKKRKSKKPKPQNEVETSKPAKTKKK